MPTIDIQHSASNHGAYEADDNTGFNGTDVELRAESNTVASSRFMAGMFFPGAVITGDDTVDVCLIRVSPTLTSTDDANETIFFEDEDNANNFTAEADVDQRTLTAANVDWVSVGLGTSEVDSPDLTTPLQEVIDRAGWSSGNNLCVIMKGRSVSNGNFRILSFEGDSGLAPSLYVEFTEPAANPVEVGIIRAAIPTGVSSVTYRDPNMSETPIVAWIEVVAATVDGTTASDSMLSIGATDGTNELSSAMQDEDAQGTTDTSKRGLTTACVTVLDQAGAIDGQAAFVSFDADVGAGAGITLSWTGTLSTAWLMRIELYSGENAEVGEIDPPESVGGTVTITPGFRSTFIRLGHHGRTFDQAANNGAVIGQGVCDADLNQGNIGYASSDGAAATALSFVTSEVHSSERAEGGDTALEITSITATTFVGTVRTATQATMRYFYLALDTGSIKTKVLSIDIPNSPSTPGYTVGFEAQAAGIIGGLAEAYDTDYTDDLADAFYSGVFNANDEFSNGIGADDGAGTTNTYSLSDDKAFVVTDSAGAIDIQGTLDSFDATDVNVEWTDVNANVKKAILWAIETSVAPPPPPVGSGSVGFITAPIETFSKPAYELWLTDDRGVRLAYLTFLSLEASRVVNQPGFFNMTMPMSFDINFIQPDNMVQLWRAPRGGRLALWRVYFLRKWRFASQGADQLVSFGGPDVLDLLRRRIVAAFTDSAEADKTDFADDMMKEAVTQALADGVAPVPTAGTRVWGDLSIANDLGLGPTITKSFPFKKLMTSSGQGVIPLLAKAAREAGTEVFFDIVPDIVSSNSISFQLQTFTGQPGQDHTSRVVFEERKNMIDPSLEYDYTEEENYIYATGQGEEADREVVQVSDSDRYSISQWGRIEGQADSRNQTGDGVREAGRDKLNAGRPRIRFSATPIDVSGTRFGRDWDFGDKVKAKFRNIEFDAIIRAASIKVNENGEETIDARLDFEN